MGKGLSKSSSNKIIDEDKQEVATGIVCVASGIVWVRD